MILRKQVDVEPALLNPELCTELRARLSDITTPTFDVLGNLLVSLLLGYDHRFRHELNKTSQLVLTSTRSSNIYVPPLFRPETRIVQIKHLMFVQNLDCLWISADCESLLRAEVCQNTFFNKLLAKVVKGLQVDVSLPPKEILEDCVARLISGRY